MKILKSKNDFESELKVLYNRGVVISKKIKNAEIDEINYWESDEDEQLKNSLSELCNYWVNDTENWIEETFINRIYPSIFGCYISNSEINHFNDKFTMLKTEIQNPYKKGFLKFYTNWDRVRDCFKKSLPFWKFWLDWFKSLINHDYFKIVFILISLYYISPYLEAGLRLLITNFMTKISK